MNLSALQVALRRHRRSLVLASILLAAVVALALVLPIGGDADRLADSAQNVSTRALAAADEDLGAFMDSKRWGTSLRERRAARRQEEIAGGDAPPTDRVTFETAQFVGFIAAEDRQSAFLVLPDGSVVRLAQNAALEDGRILAAIGDDTVTLRNASGDEEVLALFPLARPADDS